MILIIFSYSICFQMQLCVMLCFCSGSTFHIRMCHFSHILLHIFNPRFFQGLRWHRDQRCPRYADHSVPRRNQSPASHRLRGWVVDYPLLSLFYNLMCSYPGVVGMFTSLLPSKITILLILRLMVLLCYRCIIIPRTLLILSWISKRRKFSHNFFNPKLKTLN